MINKCNYKMEVTHRTQTWHRRRCYLNDTGSEVAKERSRTTQDRKHVEAKHSASDALARMAKSRFTSIHSPFFYRLSR